MASAEQAKLTWAAMWRHLGWGQYQILLAAGAVAIATELTLTLVGHPIAGMPEAATILAVGWAAEFVFQRRHAHCDRCGRCSLDDNIPARRLTANRIVELRAAGWSIGATVLCAACVGQEADR